MRLSCSVAFDVVSVWRRRGVGVALCGVGVALCGVGVALCGVGVLRVWVVWNVDFSMV